MDQLHEYMHELPQEVQDLIEDTAEHIVDLYSNTEGRKYFIPNEFQIISSSFFMSVLAKDEEVQEFMGNIKGTDKDTILEAIKKSCKNSLVRSDGHGLDLEKIKEDDIYGCYLADLEDIFRGFKDSKYSPVECFRQILMHNLEKFTSYRNPFNEARIMSENVKNAPAPETTSLSHDNESGENVENSPDSTTSFYEKTLSL